MRLLNRDELEAVLAHELSHVKNRDILTMTLASFIAMIASMIMQSFFFSALFGGNNRENNGAGIIIWIVAMIVYAISTLLILALSRYREFAADRGAAIITGQPSNLISALTKISGFRVPTEDLRRVEGPVSALFITPALSGSALGNLFSTHPTLEARIDALQRIEMELEA